MNKTIDRNLYVVFDLLSSALTWTVFFIFRKAYVEPDKFGYKIPIEFDNQFFIGLIFIPFFWLLLYYIVGYYTNVYRRSRLIEIGQTMLISIIGVLIIFFLLLLDDTVHTYRTYYWSFTVLLSLQFFMTYIPRIILSTRIINRIRQKKIFFNTIIIGNGEKALNIYKKIELNIKSNGNKFVGYVAITEKYESHFDNILEKLGDKKSLKKIINDYHIEEAIIAVEPSEYARVNRIIQLLGETNVIIKIVPELYDLLSINLKVLDVVDAPLIQIYDELLPSWQEHLKRLIDVVASTIAIIILLPVFLALMIGVKLSSKGPIFYSHERIGLHGKPFQIYKFRSMFLGSEKNGPALSSKNDSRITPFGLFMRKTRLDEFPQFYNVLIGNMSLVGPRPERQFFIDKIGEKTTRYSLLHKVRPGITSWGQVKYGYAENVDEMIDRLKYDIIYIKNMSLYLDFKIMIYTVLTVIKAKGK